MCAHLFLTLLATLELIPIFGHVMTKFYVVLSRSRYLAKQNRGVKFLELVQISPTRQDKICADRDADLEVRNVLCEQSKWQPGFSQDSPKNFTVKKLLQAKIELYKGGF